MMGPQLHVFSVAAVLLLYPAQCVEGATRSGRNASKPHIWLIVADDLGFGDLGYVGSDVKTPHIDKLATGGVILGHYYVMQCCSPTRAALNTGRYNIRYGLQTQVIPMNKRYGLNLDEKIMPQYFKELGYATHAMGKWHLGVWNWQYTPTYRGYDSFLGYYGGSENYYTHKDMGIDFHLDIGPKCGPNCSVTDFADNGNYSSEVYARHGVEVVKAHDATTPLFLHTPFQSVHAPIQAPPESVAPYLHLLPQRQQFAGMLSCLDDAIGMIMDEFVAKGMDNNLLTIFTTDNGGPVGSVGGKPHGIGGATGSQNWPLRGGKGAYYQGGVRGTAWINAPMLHKSITGTWSYALMHVTDILPTMVAAAGGDPNEMSTHPLDGVSQWDHLTQGIDGPREDLLINIEREQPTTGAHRTPGPGIPDTGCNGVGMYAVIKGPYKLIVGGGGQPNTWYHDGLPYNGTEPVPEGGCVVACSVPSPTSCPQDPYIQIYNVLEDEGEHHNLASNTTLEAELMEILQKYNSSKVVRPLSVTTPIETGCPFVDSKGVLTPCVVNGTYA